MVETNGKILKYANFGINGFGIPPVSLTASGLPSVDSNVLRILAGNPK